MYRLIKYRVGRGIAKSSICLIFLIGSLSCNDNPTDPMNNDEDYLFIDMFIWSYALQLEGDCTILVAYEPNTFYTYDTLTKSLNYRRGTPFPVNDDLQVVLGFTHVYAPLAGVFDAEIRIFPVYHFPDQLTELTRINAIDFSGTTAELVVGFSSKSHHSISLSTGILLPQDSTFEKVFKTIEGGDTESRGDSCIWEYTDSLVIRNYGLNPKSNISWESIGGSG